MEWSPATYRLRSLRSLRLVPASCWFGLWVESWVGLWFLWTVWWQVCAHGGGMGCVGWGEASAERNPLLG